MSDVNLNFSIVPVQANLVVSPNEISFTPTPINMTFTTGGLAIYPSGSGGNRQVTFNDSGDLGGSNNFTFNKATNVLAITGNVNIAGVTSLGSVSNVKIAGGTSGYVLQTDGLGNLDWTAMGGGGTGSPGGANTQVQFNNAGLFGGVAGFTFTTSNNTLTVPNIVSNGSQLSNLSAANIVGQVGNALVAGTVYTNAQPNITSTGTLTSLNVNGTSSIQQALEKVTPNATGSTGTINYDLLTQAIIQKTSNATSNFVLNFRGNSSVTMNDYMNDNQSTTCTYVNKNGATPYYLSSITIDTVTSTVNWLFGAAPSAATTNPNGYDVYQFNFIKSGANTYTVYGSIASYN